MNAKSLLDEMERKGVRISFDGDHLGYRTTREPLTPELLGELKAWKSEIISLLRGEEPEEDVPLPYFNSIGDLVIPFDADPKYFWWAGGQSISETREELQ